MKLEVIVFTIPLEIGDLNSEATVFMTQRATGGTNFEAIVFTTQQVIGWGRNIEITVMPSFGCQVCYAHFTTKTPRQKWLPPYLARPPAALFMTRKSN
jgi:hypothetical protein